MAEALSIFTTIEDLRSCSNDVLVAGIDAVGREVIISYILELREKLKQALDEIDAHTRPSAPPPPQPAVDGNLEEIASGSEVSSHPPSSSALEPYIALCKSFKAVGKSFPITIRNETRHSVDVIWKDYDGNEVIVRPDLLEDRTYIHHTYFKHPFIAREAVSKKLLVFNNEFGGQTDYSYVFEGLNFGVSPEKGINIVIKEKISKYYIELPVLLLPDYNEGEKLAALAKSDRQSIDFKVKFKNQTPQVVEVIWKDHDGNEVVKDEINPYDLSEKQYTYFTHYFIVSEKTTRQLRSFRCGGKSSFVFEAHAFGFKPRTKPITYEISIRYLGHNCMKN